MAVRDAIKEEYVALLRAHMRKPTGEYLTGAADLARKLMTADVPIEDIVAIHQEALADLAPELAANSSMELVSATLGPLAEVLRVCSLEIRARAAEQERARDAAQQLIKTRNAELERTNSKLKETMAQLLATQRRVFQSEKLAALGRLVAGVGHELNNPIMGVLNYVQYCLEHTAENDPRYSRLMKAVRELERCGRIISSLGSYSRGSGGEGNLQSEQTDCRILITETVELLAAELRRLNIKLTVNIPEDLPAIWTDPGALRQILLNLLTNARDAVVEQERKEVTVTASADEGWVAIAVADTGCGMSTEVMNRLFDPFFTTKPVGEGTGLGMSISQNLAKRVGAHIEVDSQVGEGTVVTVYLPVDRRAAAGANQATGTECR